MEYAIDKTTQQKIHPTKGAKGICQACGTVLVAKCGKIKMHHWSHITSCTDKWWSHETEWHRTWKSHFPPEWREFIFTCEKTGEKHIADIYCPEKKLVIEFQNSTLNVSEIEARESFYKQMMWVINKELLPIQIDPLEILILDLNEQYESFINERINDALPISRFDLINLYSYKDHLFKSRKKGSFNYEFDKILSCFNRIIDDLISKDTFNNPLISKPSEIKKDISYKFLEIAKQDINLYIEKNQSLHETEQYYSYKQRNSKSIWNFANKEVFIDNGFELYWLVSDRILKKVPKIKFISKYSITS
jgi:competence CoiA-like predicted nuclease